MENVLNGAKKSFHCEIFALLKWEIFLRMDTLNGQCKLIIWEKFGVFYPDVFSMKTS
jgi:hypothetical protein